MIIPFGRRTVPLVIGVAAAIGGTAVALHYRHLGLTLTHYDARGHLVVARRIVDSITPGWQQIGAVWLPLPHLLNALPAQLDVLYRTGASAVAISVVAFAIACAAIASIVQTLTGSTIAAATATAIFALNPNVLYLQSTPMTEPLLIGLIALSVASLMRIAETADLKVGAAPAIEVRSTGLLFALACLTRYEAWPVTGAALAATVWTLWRRGEPLDAALRRVAAIAVFPAVAIAGFFVFSRIVIGEWFVSSGFFVPENKALDRPVLAAAEIWWGALFSSGTILLWVGVAGTVLLALLGLFRRRLAHAMIAISLVATAALPWAAFVQGHPFRIRYTIPLIVAEAIGAGALVGFATKARALAALVVLAAAGYELGPLDTRSPMVIEAQWDRPNGAARQHVTDCLVQNRDGEKVMASMGSLGHYMQETSRAGFDLRDYLHEGNGDIWLSALERPAPFAGWILIEEAAEGGDMLATRAREHPHFLDEYSRVCEGGSVALYRRDQKRMLIVNR